MSLSVSLESAVKELQDFTNLLLIVGA